MSEPILVACDASCSKLAGTGYIIYGNTNMGIRHKIISRRLKVASNASWMELQTVVAALKNLPDDSEIILVCDCDLLSSLDYHESVGFKNKHNVVSDTLQTLKDYCDLVKEKRFSVTLWTKDEHEWHNMCHNGCLKFRETIQRGTNMYELYGLDRDFKATLISRHFSKKDAEMAACARYFTKADRNEKRTTIALASTPQKTVKDLDGYIWRIK